MPEPTKQEKKLMDWALETSTSFFTRMCKESPHALFALTDMWRLWADPDTSVEAFAECFDGLIDQGWMDGYDLLGIAVDLNRPRALKALAPRIDLSSFGTQGYHLDEETDEETGKPLLIRRGRGWVLSALVDREPDTVDLVTMAQVSESPTVWCENLPMLGQRVTWLELALATGQWETAEALWKIECDKGPLENQTYARLALAWMARLVEFQPSRWGDSDKQAPVMLTWWDRLLPTTYLMLEEVPVKPEWAHRILRGTSQGRPNHEDIPPPDTIRPMDMLLEVVARVRTADAVVDKLAQRMKAVDWSTVPADGWGRTAAQAALGKHASARESRGNHGSAYQDLWPTLLRDNSPEQQDEWWKHAFGMVLDDHVPLASTSLVFKGRYAFDDTRVLIDRLVQGLDEDRSRSGVTQSFRTHQSTVVLNLVSNVLGAVMACSNREAKVLWKDYRAGVVKALSEVDHAAGPDAPEWRGLDLALRLPVVEVVSKPKMRF